MASSKKSKTFNNDDYCKSEYVVIGVHNKMRGILSHHISEWHATYNSMMFNLDNGNTTVIPKTELNNIIANIQKVYSITF